MTIENNSEILAVLLPETRDWTLPAKANYPAKNMIEYNFIDVKSGINATRSTEQDNWLALIGDPKSGLYFAHLKLGSPVPLVTIKFGFERKGITLVERLEAIETTTKTATFK